MALTAQNVNEMWTKYKNEFIVINTHPQYLTTEWFKLHKDWKNKWETICGDWKPSNLKQLGLWDELHEDFQKEILWEWDLTLNGDALTAYAWH